MTTDDSSVTRWSDDETLRMALEASRMGLWSWDSPSNKVIWDDRTCLIYGVDPGTGPDSYDEYLTFLHPDDRAAVQQSIGEALRTGVYHDVEHRIIRPDGSVRWLLAKGSLLRSPDGAPLKIIGGVVDITERVEAERREAQKAANLAQAHQMEMVGRLAGGLAHDFNNLLTIINGYTELLLGESGATDRLRETLERILRAGESAAELTRQLLAYGRKQVLRPIGLDLNRTLAALHPLLSRLAGENVNVQLGLKPEVAAVHADPLQLENVIINLVMNARDAMPFGGELLIGTACVERTMSSFPLQEEVPPGRHIMLTVTDSGVGMDEETQRQVFEPFFTTKEFGKGTGLGLSIVQGIIAQSGGSIEVRSQPGKGTTFTIYLPETPAETPDPGERGPAMLQTSHARNGKGNVLVVEDESEVRDYAATVLMNCGYKVIKADNAVEAFEVSERERDQIDLVLADVVMPGVSGTEMSSRLKSLRPGIKVLYMSGYTADGIAHHGVPDPETDFIQKPFTPRQLSSKVREILTRG
jgi:two-component system, cell cycle sensor histidine kinase and response regulator CckA